MELDLLKETWPTIDSFANLKNQKILTTDEDNSIHSIWEENYQDLSGWCIDPFQGQCAFPIGELEENKYSGVESEDNVVSIKKTGAIGRVGSMELPGEQANLSDSSLKVAELPLIESETRNNQVGGAQAAIKTEILDTRPMEINDILLLDPIDSSMNQRTDEWIQFGNVDLPVVSPISLHHKSINHKQGNNVISVEYPSTILTEVAKNEKDNWETINTFDNTESETFDLLSYLCDDNIESPDGSIISRDSEPATIVSNSSIAGSVDGTSSSTTTTTRDSHKSRKSIGASREEYAEAKSSSSASIAAISAALDSVAKMSERSSRNRQKRNSRSMRSEYDAEVEKRRGKKRCLDSESEDRMSGDGSYRESREKNNEASRKSRQNKKAKENEMMMKANELEKDNRILKMKVDELDKLVTSMRTAILRSAMKKTS
ncbi:uncharacterized protein [Venturia canescens]|uniref:uncharacterized protein n=1 Tax=Venturia canescens TaxID=32260 RepID=UPI001C9C3093|nr:uncharacterized protein LOC122406398 [Venturia canescens]XP_043267759.1 uncharacterized protein LOC122406398 [Venturia canescens]